MKQKPEIIPTPMQTLYFERALLPTGWVNHVAITVDAQGVINSVVPESFQSSTSEQRGCLLPGVPNLHSHAHQRAMAGLAEHAGESVDSFWSWREVMYRCVNNITPQQLESIAAQLYVEMLKAGYTTVAEFQYLHHDARGKPYAQRAEMTLRTCAAARRAGIAMTSLPVLYGFGDFGGAPPRAGQMRFINDLRGYLEVLSATAHDISGDPNLSIGLAPHSLRAIDRPLLEKALADAPADAYPIHIHIAEQTGEVDACLAWSNKRPVEWLLDNFDVDDRWCLVHATHMNSAESKRLARSAAVVGLCPSTEANLGDGLFNGRFLQERGRFGIGSDSHISVSPVEELRWLEYGQRLHKRARNVLLGGGHDSSGRFLFEHAVAGGAQACGRRTGRIQAGYRADFIVIDTTHPQLYGRSGNALLDSWIFSGNANTVRDVYVGGKQVVQNYVHAQEDQILARYKRAIDQLKA